MKRDGRAGVIAGIMLCLALLGAMVGPLLAQQPVRRPGTTSTLSTPRGVAAAIGAPSMTTPSVSTTLTLAAGADMVCAAGASDVDLSLSTGFMKTPSGAWTQKGAMTFDANKGIAYLAGTGGIDTVLGTGPHRFGAASATLGFFAVSAVSRAGAFTQTYSTASHTVPADTSNTITDSSGGTASTTAIAAQAVTVAANACAGGATPTAAEVDTAVDGLETAIGTQLTVIRNNTATLAAELALAKADALATKKALNGLIDDLQAYGLCQ